jgi:hypothetical protein
MRVVANVLKEEMRLAIDALVRHEEAQLAPDERKRYEEGGVPIHARTMVRELNDWSLVGDPKPLSGGKLSVPKEVRFKDDNLPHGVFKASTDPKAGFGSASRAIGIDENDARMSVRNVATKAMDDLCKFDLVPQTRYAMIGGELGVVMGFAGGVAPEVLVTEVANDQEKTMVRLYKDLVDSDDMTQKAFDEVMAEGQLYYREDGVLMGKHTASITGIDFDDPNLRRDLTKLQLLDALCGQGDRHGGNYVVQLDENGKYRSLKAIDNDQSFGKTTDPNQLCRGRGPDGVTGVMLPEVIDTSMASTFLKMSEEDLRRELGGLLNEQEIDAAVQRLEAIKLHIAGLPKENLIDPTDWDGEIARKANQPDLTRKGWNGEVTHASYAAREKANAPHAPLRRTYAEMER